MPTLVSILTRGVSVQEWGYVSPTRGILEMGVYITEQGSIREWAINH